MTGTARPWRWLPQAYLVCVCLAACALALPVVRTDIGDPNRIVYVNADEGGLMDEAWFYYSGEKRPSFQWDFDYGLEMKYVADIARIIPACGGTVTPGLLVLMLRLLHLAAWVAAIIALWLLVGRHFGRGWQQAVCITLLAARPAFDYFMTNLKPEPLVLFFMITGLDHALRIIDAPSRRSCVIAVAMAAAAFVTKFAGVFLLPPVFLAIYLARRLSAAARSAFPVFSFSWTLPALCGIFLIVAPVIPLAFYVRKSTGMTWVGQHGLWGSIAANPTAVTFWIAGACLLMLALALRVCRSIPLPGGLRRVVEWVGEVDSIGLVVAVLFAAWCLVIGVRWLFDPAHCITIYGQLGPVAEQRGQSADFLGRLMVIDPFIAALLALYVTGELAGIRSSIAAGRARLYKRLVVAALAAPVALLFLTSCRMGEHNILPIFVACAILGVQGAVLLRERGRQGRSAARIGFVIACVLIAADIAWQGALLVRARVETYRQREDVSFEIARWWRAHISPDDAVVADHYTRVYIPPGYPRVSAISWNALDWEGELRRLVDLTHPRYLYLTDMRGDEPFPDASVVLAPRRLKLLRSFTSVGRPHQKNSRATYYIYEVL